MDAEVGRILDALREKGFDKNTLVVFSADHGEDLYERNYFFGHSPSVYDSTLRIPLIVSWPENARDRGRVESVIESVDIAPTILAIAGLSSPETFLGKSLTGLMSGQETRADAVAIAELDSAILTVRSGKYRYVRNPESAKTFWKPNPDALYPIATRELYAVESDPGELDNIAETSPETIARLERALQEWIARTGWTPLEGTFTAEGLDADVQEELRALGYID